MVGRRASPRIERHREPWGRIPSGPGASPRALPSASALAQKSILLGLGHDTVRAPRTTARSRRLLAPKTDRGNSRHCVLTVGLRRGCCLKGNSFRARRPLRRRHRRRPAESIRGRTTCRAAACHWRHVERHAAGQTQVLLAGLTRRSNAELQHYLLGDSLHAGGEVHLPLRQLRFWRAGRPPNKSANRSFVIRRPVQ